MKRDLRMPNAPFYHVPHRDSTLTAMDLESMDFQIGAINPGPTGGNITDSTFPQPYRLPDCHSFAEMPSLDSNLMFRGRLGVGSNMRLRRNQSFQDPSLNLNASPDASDKNIE